MAIDSLLSINYQKYIHFLSGSCSFYRSEFHNVPGFEHSLNVLYIFSRDLGLAAAPDGDLAAPRTHV